MAPFTQCCRCFSRSAASKECTAEENRSLAMAKEECLRLIEYVDAVLSFFNHALDTLKLTDNTFDTSDFLRMIGMRHDLHQ